MLIGITNYDNDDNAEICVLWITAGMWEENKKEGTKQVQINKNKPSQHWEVNLFLS